MAKKEFQLTTFPNGLRLVTIPMPQVESTTVMVGVGAGSRFETRQTNGLFHFLEHMAFKGTRRRPSTLAIATEVDAIGGAFNAFTSKELTGYYLKAAAKHTPLAFDILSDMLTNSLFKKEEIDREKGVILEEINLYEDTPTRHVWEIFERLFFGDNPMGWDIAGEKEIIRKIEREDFLSCLARLYGAQNLVVAVAGKLEEEKIADLTRKYFGPLERKTKPLPQLVQLDQQFAKAKLLYKKTEQAHFCLGVPAYDLHSPKRYAQGLLSVILGGGMSSRLFIEIRERRGLAYYVSCAPELFTDAGYFVVNAGVTLGKINEAIKVSLEQMGELADKKVPLAELAKAKEYVKGGMVLALEDSQHVASRYASQLLLEKKLTTPAQTMREIDKVTAEDVQQVAADLFRSSRLNLALIGPYKNEEEFRKLLSL